MRLRVIMPLLLDAEISITKTLTRRAERGRDAMQEAAEMILSEAKIIAPDKDGHLRKSGRVDMSDGVRGLTSAFIIFGNSTAYYASMHEHWPTASYVNPTTDDTFPHFLKLGFEAFGGSSPISSMIANAIGRA